MKFGCKKCRNGCCKRFALSRDRNFKSCPVNANNLTILYHLLTKADDNEIIVADGRDFMKEIITNLALLIVLCIFFSGLTACSGTQSNSANGNSANANAQTTKTDPAAYPPLAVALADAEFDLLDGTKSKLSDHKGKVLLVNIWGTWCGPCRAEMPSLIAMQDQYRDKGLEIIGLNIGDGSGTPEPIDAIKAFVEKMKLNYTIAIAPNSTTNQFYAITKASVVPQTILVDRDGHLRGVFIGGGPNITESMKQNLEKAMAE